MTRLIKDFKRACRLVLAHAYHHADAAVEGAIHFSCFDIAIALQPIENLWPLPTLSIYLGVAIIGQHPGYILEAVRRPLCGTRL